MQLLHEGEGNGGERGRGAVALLLLQCQAAPRMQSGRQLTVRAFATHAAFALVEEGEDMLREKRRGLEERHGEG